LAECSFIHLWRVSCELVGEGWSSWQKDVYFEDEKEAQEFISSECLHYSSVKAGKRIFKSLDLVICGKYQNDIFCCGSPIQIYNSKIGVDVWKWPHRFVEKKIKKVRFA